MALTACGGSDEQSSDSDEECLIFVNGNELCGASARGYCEQFVASAGNARDASTCRRLGVDIGETQAERLAREEGEAEQRERAELGERAPVEEAVTEALGDREDALIGVRLFPGQDERVIVALFEDIGRERELQVCRAVTRVRPNVSLIDLDGVEFVLSPGRGCPGT